MIGLSLPGVAITSLATLALSANNLRYAPILVETPIVIDQLVCEITTASAGGTTVRMAIYAADTDWQPGALIVDSGTVAADAIAVKTASVAVVLSPGRYLTAINTDSTPTLRRLIGGSNLFGIHPNIGANPLISQFGLAVAYGAFLNPGTVWASGAEAVSSSPPNHFVFLRVATP